jgi:hypothetical protein
MVKFIEVIYRNGQIEHDEEDRSHFGELAACLLIEWSIASQERNFADGGTGSRQDATAGAGGGWRQSTLARQQPAERDDHYQNSPGPARARRRTDNGITGAMS